MQVRPTTPETLRNLVAGTGEQSQKTASNSTGMWGADGFGFDDLLDIINPLQHLPVVSTLYRAITHDEIAPGARLIGDTALGGPIGFGVALANVIVEEHTGKDIGGTMVAMLTGNDTKSTPAADDVQVAALESAPAAGPASDDARPVADKSEAMVAENALASALPANSDVPAPAAAEHRTAGVPYAAAALAAAEKSSLDTLSPQTRGWAHASYQNTQQLGRIDAILAAMQ